MNNNIIRNQIKAYGEAFSKYGATPKGYLWSNRETQFLRFERLIHNLKDDLHDAKIHDIGPGTCDFHNFLLSKNIQHHYSGTEIVQEMIDCSIEKYPEIKIFNRNFLTIADEYYDFIFLSGTLNLKLTTNDSEWMQWSLDIINKMFQHATKAISFNCLTSYNTFSADNLMYYNPQNVLDYCIKNLSRFVILDNSYPLYEFTITVFKKEYIENKYKDEAFKKYLK
jgi:hypothetical protein